MSTEFMKLLVLIPCLLLHLLLEVLTVANFLWGMTAVLQIYGMKREGEGLAALEDFVTTFGAPLAIRRDNSRMQTSEAWTQFTRKMQIKSETTEPHHQWQNPAERRIQTIKKGCNELMDRKGTPGFMWLLCMQYYSSILNMCCLARLGGRNAYEVAFGHSVDISAWIQFEWWEPIYYLAAEDPSFQASKEKLGYFCGVAENCGDLLTFKIYTPDSHQILHRSVIRSASNPEDQANIRAANPNYNPTITLDSDSDLDDDMDVVDAADPTHLLDIVEETGTGDDPVEIEVTPPLVLSRDDLDKSDPRLVDCTTNNCVPDPNDLLGFTYPMEEDDGEVYRAEVIGQDASDPTKYIVESLSGKTHLVEYNTLIDKYLSANDEDDQLHTFSDIIDHRRKGRKWQVLVDWDAPHLDPTWQPLRTLKEASYTVAAYEKGTILKT